MQTQLTGSPVCAFKAHALCRGCKQVAYEAGSALQCAWSPCCFTIQKCLVRLKISDCPGGKKVRSASTGPNFAWPQWIGAEKLLPLLDRQLLVSLEGFCCCFVFFSVYTAPACLTPSPFQLLMGLAGSCRCVEIVTLLLVMQDGMKHKMRISAGIKEWGSESQLQEQQVSLHSATHSKSERSLLRPVYP